LTGVACLLFLPGCSKESEEEKAQAPAPVQITTAQQDANIRRIVSGGVLFGLDREERILHTLK
jgi:PBP1b-binding outer membrane lipoprotein LpoB